MKHWPTKPLGQLCTVVTERASEGTTPYVEIGNLDPKTKEINASDKLAVKGAFTAEIGDIIVSRVRPTRGAIALLRQRSLAVSSAFTILRSRDEITNAYLFFSLAWNRTFLNYLGSRSKGALYPTVPEKDVLAYEVPVPPLSEQQRIGNLLGEVDALRKLRVRADSRAAGLIPAVFVEMFGDVGADRIRWPRRSLGDVIADGPQNGLYKHSSFYGDGIPILRIDAFYDGDVEDLSSLKRLRVTLDEIEHYSLRENDIVINRVNSPKYLGKSALIPTLTEPTVFESNMMRFSVGTAIEPGYLIRYLQTPSAKQQILSRAKHSINQSSINQEDVKSMLVPLPSTSLQKEFVHRVADIRLLEANQAVCDRRLDDLFQSMLDRAFCGEL